MSFERATFTLEIDLEGDALSVDTSGELARILRRVADRVADGSDAGTALDVNGNTVGSWVIR